MFATGDVLSRFARDLTAEARAGRLEPVRCRDAEIGRIVDILLRQGKNNPVLVGPAGVGKTAIVEGLAQRIAAGDIALSLRDVRVLALDHVGIMAGTTFRGQYEERIRALIEAVSSSKDAILFIDELHNLIGQGTAMGVAMDAANMLKPALVRGDFRVIGATTDAEYAQWIRGDPALERRFQKVDVRELGVAETLEILRARKRGLERHHNVVIDEDALTASIELTDRHVTDRTRPDRALDALDEACAHRQADARYAPETERLIRVRRERLALGERPVEPESVAEEEREPDAFEMFARNGFAAIERFAADLESTFASPGLVPVVPEGMPASAPDLDAVTPPAGEPAPPAPPPADEKWKGTLDELEVEVDRRLVAEGIIVQPADIARVVSVATGRSVLWQR